MDSEEIDKLEEQLNRQQKAARTKKLKYGENIHAQWGSKGGKARNPNKGYGSNPDKTGGRMKQRARYENQTKG